MIAFLALAALAPPALMIYTQPGRTDDMQWFMDLAVWPDGRVIWHSFEPLIPVDKPKHEGYYFEGQIPKKLLEKTLAQLESVHVMDIHNWGRIGVDTGSRAIVVRSGDKTITLAYSGTPEAKEPRGEDKGRWLTGYQAWNLVLDFQKGLQPKGQHEVEEPNYSPWIP